MRWQWLKLRQIAAAHRKHLVSMLCGCPGYIMKRGDEVLSGPIGQSHDRAEKMLARLEAEVKRRPRNCPMQMPRQNL